MKKIIANNQQESGFILINKPVGPTSHDIIYTLRRLTGIKKIGHAGTLDPLASGVLVIAIGRAATREISQYVKLDKEYLATLFLGATTDTYDREGEVINSQLQITNYKLDEIKKVLEKFIGAQKQVPPMFSAKKVKGKKLYQLARQGIEVERTPNDIKIYSLKLISFEWPILKIKTKCSSGTYIRSLANDIGEALGCGAYLDGLERTRVGKFKIKKAVKLEELNEDNWKTYLL